MMKGRMGMDNAKVKDALETVNNAIFELNNGKTDSEDYYWWRAVLEIFGYDVDDGEIIPETYSDGRIVGTKC